jgi:hypothetical protein
MKKLYEYLLKSDYFLEHHYSHKAFTFKKTDGDWSRSITISKYHKDYEVTIIEGLPNFIKQIKKSFKTYKEVVALL